MANVHWLSHRQMLEREKNNILETRDILTRNQNSAMTKTAMQIMDLGKRFKYC